mmetsp:Transcript_2855/g.3922  ORF Transcript_2855/g.3922 Transcript_2855/m.3922 type:complete len:222 (-) Transcript_2855:138-803(-)
MLSLCISTTRCRSSACSSPSSSLTTTSNIFSLWICFVSPTFFASFPSIARNLDSFAMPWVACSSPCRRPVLTASTPESNSEEAPAFSATARRFFRSFFPGNAPTSAWKPIATQISAVCTKQLKYGTAWPAITPLEEEEEEEDSLKIWPTHAENRREIEAICAATEVQVGTVPLLLLLLLLLLALDGCSKVRNPENALTTFSISSHRQASPPSLRNNPSALT